MRRAELTESDFASRIQRTARGVAGWLRAERLPPLNFLPIMAQALMLPSDPPEFEKKILSDLQSDVPERQPVKKRNG
jgi:transcriptional regulator with XRE-family HTH domain